MVEEYFYTWVKQLGREEYEIENAGLWTKEKKDLNNKELIAGKILSGESSNLRSDLCIAERKYDGLWGEILDLLQNAVCQNVYDEKICEDGLMALTMFLNTLRIQRPLVSFGQEQSSESQSICSFNSI